MTGPQLSTGSWPMEIVSDDEAISQLQATLLRHVEGEREGMIDDEYRALRQAFLDNPNYAQLVPRFVRIHRDLGAMWPYMKSFNAQWEPRRQHVRQSLEPLFNRADELATASNDADPPWPGTPAPGKVDSADWTGTLSRTQKLAAAKTLLPVARASIERLMEELGKPSHNGGPPLDETVEAIEHLRKLHKALGDILEGIEGNRWSEIEGMGLPAEAARYARRFARAVRDDPMPYAASALLLTVLTACGFPGIAGYLSGVAITVQKGRQS